jgi:hypothetical protein
LNRINEDLSVVINDFISEAEQTARSLAARYSLPIKCEHVEAALVGVFGLDDSLDLLDRGLTTDIILSALSAFDFRRFFPELLTEFRVHGSIVSPGGLRHLLEQTVRVHGEVWRVYKNDADPFPSNPHAHNVQSGLKLHLGTGDLFFRREIVQRISLGLSPGVKQTVKALLAVC